MLEAWKSRWVRKLFLKNNFLYKKFNSPLIDFFNFANILSQIKKLQIPIKKIDLILYEDFLNHIFEILW